MENQLRTTPSISLKHDQRQVLEAWAEEHGISLGAYFKKVALGEIPQKNRNLKESSITAKDFLDLYKEVTKIGVNLNQIAKRLHLYTAKRKANGEEDMDLSEYEAEDIKFFVEIFENVEKHLSNMKTLIQEVV